MVNKNSHPLRWLNSLYLKIITLTLMLGLSGCNIIKMSPPEDFAKYALPANMALGWFGNVAIHEGGHALAAYSLGANEIDVSIFPGRYDGQFHFGYTTAGFPREISRSEQSLFLTSGTAATLLSHVTFGEANRSGHVSKYLQPTLQWMDFGGMMSSYSQSIFGLARIRHTDLGREDAWMAAGFLSAQVIYDVFRIGFSEGGFEKYFNVLLGNDFYE